MSARRAAAGVALITAALVLVVLVSSGRSAYTVRAEFANASGLRQNFKVTLGGVAVGSIKDVKLSPRDTAIATMEIDDGAGPLGKGAAASIKPTNLLGEKVVVLAPGDLRHPAPSGTTIPLSRTSTPVELDDVLNTLDGETRTALAIFLAEQGDALVGRTADLAGTLDRMPPALQDARRLIGDLAWDNRALGRLVQSSDRVVASIARERRGLAALVDSAGGALDALGSRRAGLTGTVRNAPGAIAQLRSSLVALQRAAEPLIPAARGLRAAAPPLATTLRELSPFTASARPALRTLRAVSPSLRRLGRDGTPVVRRLAPLAGELSTFARVSQPVTETLDLGRSDLFGMIEGWARATQNRDAAGHVFRLGVTLSDYAVKALLEQYIAPPATRSQRAHGPTRPAPSQPALPAVEPPALKLPNVKLPAVTVPRVELPHVAGHTDASVKRLLDYLLK